MECNSPALKLAIAIALIRSKLQKKPSSSSSPSQSLPKSDAAVLRWRKLAKKRKRQLVAIEHQLSQLQDEMQFDLFPQNASCKCYFFDQCGKLVNSRDTEDECRINEALRRRFLRLVRWMEKTKRANSSLLPRRALEPSGDNELEWLGTSIDFLVEICSRDSPVENYPPFASSSHQAVDLILASLKILLSRKKKMEPIEGIVGNLIIRLTRRMCPWSEGDGSRNSSDVQLQVQHIMRKLGSEPYIGQRTMLLVSQRISAVADSMLFMDPFDDNFPNMHNSMLMMVQLVEFLVSDYTQSWTKIEGFESRLFEEWVRYVVQAQKALSIMESRNGLYILYLDRVIGELVKQVGSISHSGTLDLGVLGNLFH